jgi:hypothetical protein
MVIKTQMAGLFTLFAAAWLALAVLWAGVFIIAEHGHEHVDYAGHRVPDGRDCRICLQIQIALRLIEAFGRLFICITVAGFTAYAFSFIKQFKVFCPLNPIRLKVKINC